MDEGLEAVMLWGKSAMDAWPVAEPILHKAYLNGFNSVKLLYIQEEINEGRMQLWLIFDYEEEKVIAAMVTKVIDNGPKGRWMEAFYGAGERMNEWKDLILEKWENYAEEMECDGVVVSGRLGWQRVCRANGYKAINVVLCKHLNTIH